VSSLEAELKRARELDVGSLADAIETIGFECTRCGACCKGYETDDGREPHTATVFPDEIRRLQGTDSETGAGTPESDSTGTVGPRTDREGDDSDGESPPGRDDPTGPMREATYDWRDVARPMPYGLKPGADGPEGETFEWALAVDDCGDCVFYEEQKEEESPDADSGTADGTDEARETTTVGSCTVHEDRPLVCRTYPFSVALGGTSQPMGEAVDEVGLVRAHECEGLGRAISRAEATDLAAALKRRAVRELVEAIAVRDAYDPVAPGPGEIVVHDSEGAKRADGSPHSTGGTGEEPRPHSDADAT
jgi:hypothetical protein